ncbi:MAG: lipoprotein-releasing system ATP-binding protein LolD [Flavobacteriales bacterium]|nr:lipoprotein-releasing system ATP-binding protein LolD [Flavobacteriales bacterium]|tara:strand:+ start:771 stop:1424 length:654 start_codon:yes stop_codon:yes gene_type:complete
MIKVKDIHLNYGELKVLKGVNLNIEKGDFVSIVGSSGAGKTTLLQLIGTLENPTEGSIEINGTDITKLSDQELSSFRNKNIGFVFQFHNLLAEFTALENVCLPAFLNGENRKDVEQRALELLKLLNIENRKDHKPNELSGGEQQRVAVARALINSASIILADEPSGNLDSKNAEELHNLLLKLNKDMGQTIVVVTHNNNLANITQKKIEIKDGVIKK